MYISREPFLRAGHTGSVQAMPYRQLTNESPLPTDSMIPLARLRIRSHAAKSLTRMSSSPPPHQHPSIYPRLRPPHLRRAARYPHHRLRLPMTSPHQQPPPPPPPLRSLLRLRPLCLLGRHRAHHPAPLVAVAASVLHFAQGSEEPGTAQSCEVSPPPCHLDHAQRQSSAGAHCRTPRRARSIGAAPHLPRWLGSACQPLRDQQAPRMEMCWAWTPVLSDLTVLRLPLLRRNQMPRHHCRHSAWRATGAPLAVSCTEPRPLALRTNAWGTMERCASPRSPLASKIGSDSAACKRAPLGRCVGKKPDKRCCALWSTAVQQGRRRMAPLAIQAARLHPTTAVQRQGCDL
mmetsp:Transcript_119730/g.298648  ORF Transcript_119730/g.298648 Transcript_119730/m.298648 type:complete len:347 (-) Transcript_119730:967-2007(-)